MIRSRSRCSLLAFLAFVATSAATSAFVPVAAASVVEALSVAQLSERADSVVLGEVVSVAVEWSADHRHLFRRVELRVAETLKGASRASQTVVLRGGARDGISETVLGVPELASGQQALFFLRQVGGSQRLVGLGQGVLLRDDAGGLTPQSAGLTLAGAGSDGALHLDAARPVALSLPELRRQVQGAK